MPKDDVRVLEAFYLSKKVEARSEKTIKTYTDRLPHLISLANGNGLRNVQRGDIEQYVLSLFGTVSRATINGRITVFKAFYNWCENEEIWDDWKNPTRRIRLLKEERKIKPVLKPGQIKAMIAACKPPANKAFPGSFVACRNALMIRVLYDSFIRLGELRNLRVEDVDMIGRLLLIRKSKSRRQRLVPITAKTAKEIHYYLFKYREKLPGNHLFCTTKGEPFTERTADLTFERLGKKAGITGPDGKPLRVHPHLIRHSAITQYLDNGGSIEVARQIAGHADIRTTAHIYDNGSEKRALKWHEQYSPMKEVV